jgi:hypothetical protein
MKNYKIPPIHSTKTSMRVNDEPLFKLDFNEGEPVEVMGYNENGEFVYGTLESQIFNHKYTIFVDENGDNETAEFGNENKPYKTPYAALRAIGSHITNSFGDLTTNVFGSTNVSDGYLVFMFSGDLRNVLSVGMRVIIDNTNSSLDGTQQVIRSVQYEAGRNETNITFDGIFFNDYSTLLEGEIKYYQNDPFPQEDNDFLKHYDTHPSFLVVIKSGDYHSRDEGHDSQQSLNLMYSNVTWYLYPEAKLYGYSFTDWNSYVDELFVMLSSYSQKKAAICSVYGHGKIFNDPTFGDYGSYVYLSQKDSKLNIQSEMFNLPIYVEDGFFNLKTNIFQYNFGSSEWIRLLIVEGGVSNIQIGQVRQIYEHYYSENLGSLAFMYQGGGELDLKIGRYVGLSTNGFDIYGNIIEDTIIIDGGSPTTPIQMEIYDESRFNDPTSFFGYIESYDIDKPTKTNISIDYAKVWEKFINIESGVVNLIIGKVIVEDTYLGSVGILLGGSYYNNTPSTITIKNSEINALNPVYIYDKPKVYLKNTDLIYRSWFGQELMTYSAGLVLDTFNFGNGDKVTILDSLRIYNSSGLGYEELEPIGYDVIENDYSNFYLTFSGDIGDLFYDSEYGKWKQVNFIGFGADGIYDVVGTSYDVNNNLTYVLFMLSDPYSITSLGVVQVSDGFELILPYTDGSIVCEQDQDIKIYGTCFTNLPVSGNIITNIISGTNLIIDENFELLDDNN